MANKPEPKLIHVVFAFVLVFGVFFWIRSMIPETTTEQKAGIEWSMRYEAYHNQ